MKEKNRQQLEAALQRLPEYAAPEQLWEQLNARLKTERLVENKLPHLPKYEPPADLWPQLESALDADQPIRATRRLSLWRPLLIAAASVSLLLSAWWLIREGVSMASVQYSQETIDESLLLSAAEPEDGAFQLIDELCRYRIPVCEEPAFRQMKAELDELTAAKTALSAAMGRYSTDPALHSELARIERERSELLRSMMSMIWG